MTKQFLIKRQAVIISDSSIVAMAVLATAAMGFVFSPIAVFNTDKAVLDFLTENKQLLNIGIICWVRILICDL